MIHPAFPNWCVVPTIQEVFVILEQTDSEKLSLMSSWKSLECVRLNSLGCPRIMLQVSLFSIELINVKFS